MSQEISQWSRSRLHDFSLSDEIIQNCLTDILSGKEAEPLPGKEVVRAIEKKMKRKQHLIRVWEFELPSGGKPLIFELQDGSLWELCDVGLGCTKFQNKESNGIENPVIKLYLPSDIIPRPENSKPWEYEFNLKGGAVLWVKLGKRPKTFKWGVRTKKN